ncbi:MOSC domain-containing protein [Terrabacter carboxydivorans]|uniref:MOSC domain-containing protein n=1 Tax=Terrabacter carboxydivorans TaxID=619730 RepID=A0ABN3L3F2_9MICO
MTPRGREGVHVTALTAYPVKSLGGVSLEAAAVEAQGLRGDRRWAVVDPDGTKVTAREEHALLGLRAEPLDGGGVRLLGSGGDPVEVAPPHDAPPVRVGFSGQDRARPAGPRADDWLTARVGRPLRLVWQDDTTHRPIRPDLGGADGDRNSLSDAAPLHVTSESSLARLNDWVAETALERGEEPRDPLGHERFRPNVVVAGAEPFAEDTWATVRIGDVAFRTTMVCDRCVMTTIDRDDLSTGKEPIRTLARHRKWEGATWFGIRLTPVLPVGPDATLRVGDEVVALGR